MTDLFEISQSESLLIGRCVGHYVAAHEIDPTAYLLFYIRRFLSPYTPKITTTRFAHIDLALQSQDIIWAEADDCLRYGYRSSQGASYYVESETDCWRVWKDTSVAFLDDQLVDFLDPLLVRRTLRESARFPPGGNEWGRYQVRLLTDPYELQHVPALDIEDSAAVEQRVRELVCWNDNGRRRQLYEVGQSIGRLAFLCDRADAIAWWGIYSSGTGEADENEPGFDDLVSAMNEHFGPCPRTGFSEVKEQLENELSKLTGHPGLPAWSRARSLLSAPVMDGGGHTTLLEMCDVLAVASLREALSLAMGELIGAHSFDADTRPETAPIGRIPKWIKLTTTSSSDRVAGAIQFIENAFVNGVGLPSPSFVIGALENGIEALTRRVWPKVFSEDPNVKLPTVLGRGSTGNKAESRFARQALSIYQSYRTSAQHHLDRFDCTWQEAFSFLQTMKTLLQLSNSIVQSRAPSSDP